IYFEMLPEGASKGETLLRLAQMLGIKKENTAAVGDYYNDIELVSSAGTGFAPAGAPQEVKAAAGHVVGSCEDGAVADVIEYLERRYMGSNA
ncbi:MAG: HAD hydrolase family protein, partial [Clostridia bacterium]|nr:HAD hydrolase family protein [Clostridia bacterium]